MPELDKAALDAAEGRGQYLLPRELLIIVERFDEHAERGVSLSRLEAYAEALNERGVQSIDSDQITALISEDHTESESWTGPNAIYEVDDRLSSFPARWHDELGGEERLIQYVTLLSGDLAAGETHTATGSSGDGVPRQLLRDAASVLGPFNREGVATEIERLREDGAVRERADQHPDARVWPTHQ